MSRKSAAQRAAEKEQDMPVTSLSDLEAHEPEDVLASDGEYHDPDTVEADDMKDVPDNTPEQPLLFDDQEQEVELPRAGEVNPSPDNDAEAVAQRITKTAEELRSDANERYSSGYDSTFYSKVNSINKREVFLRDTDEAIGIDVDYGQFRIYQGKRDSLNEWQFNHLIDYIAPRELISAR